MGRRLKYEGLDVSKGMVRLAKRRYPHLHFKVADVTNYRTLPKKKYDGFFAAAVLMHIPEPEWNGMLKNIERIMKRGVTGYITLPDKRPRPRSSIDKRHFTYFAEGKFKKFTSPRGWKILRSGKMSGTRGPDTWFWFIVRLPK